MARHNSQRLRLIRLAGALALVSLCSLAAASQQTQVTLDPAQTKVNWTLGDVLHTVHGTFKMVSGTISFDPRTGNASGEILVDARTGESGNHARDSKMQREVLESARYPEITFRPKHVSGNSVRARQLDSAGAGRLPYSWRRPRPHPDVPGASSRITSHGDYQVRRALSGLGHEESQHAVPEGRQQSGDRYRDRGNGCERRAASQH